MEVLLLILGIVILVILITMKSDLAGKLDRMQKMIDELTRELKKIRSLPEQGKPETSTKERAVSQPTPEPFIPKVEKPVFEEIKEVPEVIKEAPTKIPEAKSVPVEEVVHQAFSKPRIAPLPAQPVRKENKAPKPGFFERNPDLEKFIGENLANKVGIGILVLGIGFFVKYAIDQEWINEIGRVFIGILCGGVLIGVAHRMRKTFAAFSSVLVGGGIAILYLTIFIAFHEYQLFSQVAAFILMVIITGFTILLSLAYNRIELAILAILGGFGSPFMVSTGEGNYVVLFTYVLILDVGMLVLAYYKKWNLVNIIAYIFTLLLFGSWLGARFDGNNISMIVGAIIFATLFYLVFFAMNIVNNIKERTPFETIEISMLLSNTFLYYAAGMVILNNEHGEMFKGLFTASLGIFNFVFAYLLYKNERVDKKLVFLLIGLVLTFISLAAPIQLEGNHITLFWSAEAVLLLWLSQKSGIKLMKIVSVIVMGLMIISLIMDWGQVYFDYTQSLTVIFNKGYITSIVSLASLVLTLYFLKNETSESVIPVNGYRAVITLVGVLAAYFANLLELRFHLIHGQFELSAQEIIIGSYSMLFIVLLQIFEKKLKVHDEFKPLFALWGVLGIVAYLFFYHNQIIDARNAMLDGTANSLGFVFHYLYLIILLIVSVFSLKRTQTLVEFNQKTYNIYSWFYVAFYVFIASAELDHTVVLIAYSPSGSIDHILSQNHKIGFPILWGITSFLLIAIGLKRKLKHLRIISLSLFLLTLLKLFLVDIRGISEGGKIAAFISLGVLLLIVSFMYQRLKKIILADESKQTDVIEKKDEA